MTIFSFQKTLKTLPTVEDLQTALASPGEWVTTPSQELVVYTNVLLPTVSILPTLPDSSDKNHHKQNFNNKIHFQIEVDYSFSLWLYSNFRSH